MAFLGISGSSIRNAVSAAAKAVRLGRRRARERHGLFRRGAPGEAARIPPLTC
jgi:hypothetical protein